MRAPLFALVLSASPCFLSLLLLQAGVCLDFVVLHSITTLKFDLDEKASFTGGIP